MWIVLVLLLVILLPLGEIYLLIRVGGAIGAFPTIFLVVLTAVAGVWLVRHQGLGVIARVRSALERGETPATEVVEGVLVVLAGVALLVPGFASDLVGFLLLIPPLRLWLSAGIVRRSQAVAAARQAGQSRVIEGTWSRDEDPADDQGRLGNGGAPGRGKR